MRQASACHPKVLLAARSRTLARKKAPPTKRGQGEVVMRAGGCLDGSPSPPRASPNRVRGIGSIVRSVANNDRGAATADWIGPRQAWGHHAPGGRHPVSPERPAHGAGSSPPNAGSLIFTSITRVVCMSPDSDEKDLILRRPAVPSLMSRVFDLAMQKFFSQSRNCVADANVASWHEADIWRQAHDVRFRG